MSRLKQTLSAVMLLLPCILAAVFLGRTIYYTSGPGSSYGDGGFISGKPCEMPCFLGVTPGKTSLQDLQRIVERNSRLKDCASDGTGDDLWISCSNNVSFSVSSGWIDSLGFRLADEIRLAAVLQKYGTPDGIIVFDSDPGDKFFERTSAMIFYNGLCMIIRTEAKEGNYYEFSENTLVDMVNYSKCNKPWESLLAEDAWQGFGIYTRTILQVFD